MENGYQRRVYSENNLRGKHDLSMYGEFSDINEAVKDMPYTLQVQWEDLEDFTVTPARMEINEIRDGYDYLIMYFIEEKHLAELEANQSKHF